MTPLLADYGSLYLAAVTSALALLSAVHSLQLQRAQRMRPPSGTGLAPFGGIPPDATDCLHWRSSPLSPGL